VEENPKLLPNDNLDYAVVIKYIPVVRDSKRAMDGHNTLSIYNICESTNKCILNNIMF